MVFTAYNRSISQYFEAKKEKKTEVYIKIVNLFEICVLLKMPGAAICFKLRKYFIATETG